jgi:hypothetical protein
MVTEPLRISVGSLLAAGVPMFGTPLAVCDLLRMAKLIGFHLDDMHSLGVRAPALSAGPVARPVAGLPLKTKRRRASW